jgi:hypothetical protein
MINRKALWISLLVLFAMIAADVWRLSLLPDWHHIPAEGPGNGHTISLLVLFVPILGLIFTMGFHFARKWLASGSKEALQPWQRYNGLALLFTTAMMASVEAFNLARSLGALQSVSRITLAHIIFVVGGIFMMLAGNMLPKMPWLTARSRRAQLNPWQWNRQLRFAGKVTFALGLFMAVGLPLLPVKMAPPATLGLALAVIVVNYWHRAKVKREPSPTES